MLTLFLCGVDCLSDSDCATGASCAAGVCSCDVETPVLVGDSAADTSATCVPCTGSDSGSCGVFEVCDAPINTCKRMSFIYFISFLFFFFFFFFCCFFFLFFFFENNNIL